MFGLTKPYHISGIVVLDIIKQSSQFTNGRDHSLCDGHRLRAADAIGNGPESMC
jgi:hypothetical protein